jgi:transcriptional regulator with GAF, ATPase, and Fis domain/tetratricopeptide (TPR) repeat protein
MHFGAENFSTALEYFHTALNGPGISAFPDKFRLLVRISDCHRKKGKYSDAARYLSAARELLDDPAPAIELGRVEFREGYLMLARGEIHAGQRLAFSAYRRLKDTNEHREVAGVQTLIGHYYLRSGLQSEAEEFFTDALSSYRRIDDRVGIAYAYNNLGLLHKNSCRWKRALASLSKSLDIAKTVGLTQHLILVQLNLGVVYGKLRRFNDAISSFDAAINAAERFGDQLNLTRALLMMGRTLTQMRQVAKAEKSLLRAQAMADELGYSRESALADEYLGDLMFARGDYQCALANLEASLKKARKFAPEGDVVAECLRRVADVQYRLNRPQEALKAIEEGVRIAESCGEVYELGYFYRTQGLAQGRLGDGEAAVAGLEESIDAFERYSNPYEKAISQQLLARMHIRAGEDASLARARNAVTSSIVEFTKLDETREQIVSQALLANIEQRLGNLDDALLAVYEADRLAEEEHTSKFRRALQALRNRIETRMSTSSTRVLDQFSVLGEIQSGARSRDQLIKGLDSTLSLILEHLGAGCGFVAIPAPNGRGLSVVVNQGMNKKEAQAIEAWYSSHDNGGVHVITDLERNEDASALREKLTSPTGTLLLQSLGFEGESLGVLCVHQSTDAAEVGSGRGSLGHDALHFVAAYSSLISLSIYEVVRSERKGRQRSRSSNASKGFQSIVTENKGMIQLLNLAERVAHSDATVLLQGETGTGKGLIAYAIHLLSERRERKFVHVNCAALPEQLLESELFGHVRGAFTGAFADKDGLLQQANGGTVFLDEVSKTSLAMQGKLLQFLDSSQVRKVGSNELVHVDVRVVCASKSNLLDMCEEGRFLEDFFYRINDFPLTIPPLRDRVEDIQLLVDHYIDKLGRDMDRVIDGVSDEFLDALESYRWPGNVRELEKVIKRAVILADDGETLGVEHLAPEVLQPPLVDDGHDEDLTLRERIERMEHVQILEALRRHDGNKSQAAIQLGISYPNLLSKIKRYNIQ